MLHCSWYCVCAAVVHVFDSCTVAHRCRFGASTKAAVIRIGLLEMWRFVDLYYHGTLKDTLMESCGIADLIATSFGGRNRRLSEAMVLTGKVLGKVGVSRVTHNPVAILRWP